MWKFSTWNIFATAEYQEYQHSNANPGSLGNIFAIYSHSRRLDLLALVMSVVSCLLRKSQLRSQIIDQRNLGLIGAKKQGDWLRVKLLVLNVECCFDIVPRHSQLHIQLCFRCGSWKCSNLILGFQGFFLEISTSVFFWNSWISARKIWEKVKHQVLERCGLVAAMKV